MPRETDFHRELIKDMEAQGVMLTKVPDFPSSRVMKLNDRGERVEGFRFSPTRFVDLVGVGNEIATTDRVRVAPPLWGRPLIWEAKLMTKLASFPLKSVRDDQLKALLRYEGRADARVVINYRVTNFTDKQVAKYGLMWAPERKRLNLLTSVLASDIMTAMGKGLKSIPMAELAECCTRRPWGGRWDYHAVLSTLWGPSWRST